MTYIKGKEYYFELGVSDIHGNFATGLVIYYNIYRSADNYLLDNGVMVEISSRGIYQFYYTFDTLGQYRIEYITPIRYPNTIETIDIVEEFADSATILDIKGTVDNIKIDTTSIIGTLSTMVSDIWSYITRTLTSGGGGGGLTPELEDMIKRIAGLTQENYRITNQTYDKNNNLIGGLISLYPSATDLENDTNVFATYQMSAVFNLKSNRMTDYKVKRLS